MLTCLLHIRQTRWNNSHYPIIDRSSLICIPSHSSVNPCQQQKYGNMALGYFVACYTGLYMMGWMLTGEFIFVHIKHSLVKTMLARWNVVSHLFLINNPQSIRFPATSVNLFTSYHWCFIWNYNKYVYMNVLNLPGVIFGSHPDNSKARSQNLYSLSNCRI